MRTCLIRPSADSPIRKPSVLVVATCLDAADEGVAVERLRRWEASLLPKFSDKLRILGVRAVRARRIDDSGVRAVRQRILSAALDVFLGRSEIPRSLRRLEETLLPEFVNRKLVSASDEISTAAFNTQGKPVDKILDEAEQKILHIGEEGSRMKQGFQAMDSLVVQLLDRVQ